MELEEGQQGTRHFPSDIQSHSQKALVPVKFKSLRIVKGTTYHRDSFGVSKTYCRHPLLALRPSNFLITSNSYQEEGLSLGALVVTQMGVQREAMARVCRNRGYQAVTSCPGPP